MAKKKRKNLWIWILVVVVILLIVAAIIKGKNRQPGIEVEIEEVQNRDIAEYVTASGKIFPLTEVIISSDVSGEIVELYVEEGDTVKFGQLLAKIDPDVFVSAVERGEASVNNARAQLASSRAAVENAIAQKEQIEAQLKNAQRILERNEQLYAEGVVSEADLEQSQTNVENLSANLRSSEASYRSALQNVKAAEYSVKSAEASLRELRTNLRRTTITSPMDGIVSLMNVEKGERVVGTIQMTGTEMMRISDLSVMEVQVEVSENDIVRVSLGDEVEIEVDAFVDRIFTGHVSEIANSAANTSQLAQSLTTEQVTNFIVKILIDQKSYKDLIEPGKPFPLRPGMSASVEINTDVVKDAISIPIQAVTTREDKDRGANEDLTAQEIRDALKEMVFMVKGDTVDMVEIETGIQDDEFIHVKKGLANGDKIVTGPYSAVARKLEEGDKVFARESKKQKDQ